MKYLKKYESPDAVIFAGNFPSEEFKGVLVGAMEPGSYAFGYGKNNDTEYESFFSGMLLSGDEGYHERVKNLNGELTPYTTNRVLLKYSGRLWSKLKIISFWEYPSKEEMPKLIEDLNEILHKNFLDKINDDWYIEIPINTQDGESDFYSKKMEADWFGASSKVIKMKEFLESDEKVAQWSKKDMEVIHNLDPEKKRKALDDAGYKPKGLKSPQGMSQAEYRDKTTKYKYTESFDSFKLNENPNYIFVPRPLKQHGNHFWAKAQNVTFSYYFGDLYHTFGNNNHQTLWNSVPSNKLQEVKDKYDESEDEYGDTVYGDMMYSYSVNFGRGEYAGRLFVHEKVVSFWVFPENKEILKKIINELEDKTGLSIWNDEWRVEIVLRYNVCGVPDDVSWSSENTEIIPIKEYKNSRERCEKELKADHLEIGDGAKNSEYGSRLKVKKNPLPWEQAKRTSESMIIKFKLF